MQSNNNYNLYLFLLALFFALDKLQNCNKKDIFEKLKIDIWKK